jgi:ketosteroid isomerase-like protein
MFDPAAPDRLTVSAVFCQSSPGDRLTTGLARRVGPTAAENEMVEKLHRQRVLKFLDAFYSGDLEGALACCTDDIDFIAHAPTDILPHMGHRQGKAEVLEMWQAVHARYSGMLYEVPCIVTEGAKVAVHIRVFFRKRSNDRVVQFDIADFYTLRDARIARIRQFLDTFDLVEQLLERGIAPDLTGDTPAKR